MIRICKNLNKLVHVKSFSTVNLPVENASHQPVMVREVLENLYPKDGDVILDLTFGAGGHTEAILDSCNGCKVVALDRDPVAHNLAKNLSEKYNGRIIPLLGRFSDLNSLLEENGITAINGAILDAGCSSMQFDSAIRGFSISKNGPLDMRMDGDRDPFMPSASDVVNRLSAESLADILAKYGEERYAKKIARHIVQYRTQYGPISQTQQLANVIRNAFGGNAFRKDSLNRRCHMATKSFMAIRIFVNDEINEIHAGMMAVEKHISKGGRFVVIIFHSLEDKVVKRVFSGVDISMPFGMKLSQKRAMAKEEVSAEIEEPKKWLVMKKKVVMPQFDEVEENSRSRSAKLRSATRI